MASRKEYELLFLLNASLGASYSATFKQAQSALMSYQKEIVSLNSAQSDIASYEKNKAAIDTQTQKLGGLQQRLKELNEQFANGNITQAEYTRQTERLTGQITNTENKIAQYRDRLNEIEAALKRDGVNTEQLEAEKKRLSEQLEDLRRREEEAARSAQTLEEKSVSAFETMGEAIVASGIITALNSLVEAYKGCVQIANEFGWEMANVEAISGATGGQYEALTEKAKELGATTKFTATQSAEAMGAMALAGWKTNEMLAGMDGVVQLAAAANEDLSVTTSIVADSLSGFGLEAKDSAHFADVLAAAATNSNTTVALIGDTFRYSASAAGALGYSVEDLAVAMGLMANSGIKGTMAGTALRTAMTKLVSGATLTSKAFGEYEYTAVKADGTTKTFKETVDELRSKFAQMTETEKIQNAQNIAGLRSYNGLIAILNATDEEYQHLTETIKQCDGAAERMASVKLDSAKGDIYLMTSATDALKMSLGELSEGELRTVYKRITDIADGLNEYVKKNPDIVKGIMTFVGVMGAASAALVTYSVAAKTATRLTELFGASGLAAQTAFGPVGAVIMGVTAAVAALSAVVVAANNRLIDGTHTYKQLTEAARDTQSELESIAAAFGETEGKTKATADIAERYISRLEELEAAGAAGEDVQTEYNGTLRMLTELLPEVSDQIDLETGTILTSTEALRASTREWKQNALAQAAQERYAEIARKQLEIDIERERNTVRVTEAKRKLEEAEKRHAAVLVSQSEAIRKAQEEAKAYSETTGELADHTRFMAKTDAEWNAELEKASEEVHNARMELEALNNAVADDEKALSDAETELKAATNALNELTGAEERSAEAADGHASSMDGLLVSTNGMVERIGAMTEAYNKAYTSAYESISGQSALWDEAAKAVPISIDTINSRLKKQAEYWAEYNKNLETLQSVTGEVDGLGDVIASFADGSEDSVNAVAGLAKAAEKSPEKLKELVDAYGVLTEEQSKTADSIAEFGTKYTEECEKIVEEFRKDVEAMDFSSEATEAAKSTLQAYIDAIKEMSLPVGDAFESIANQIKPKSLDYYRINAEAGKVTGYASGTDSATAGLHLVGENGPELVYMQGGEKVLNADATSRIIGGSNNVSVSFNIAGNADGSTVDRLRELADSIEARIIDALDERQRDGLRRAYA